jgi:hypothetical protein
MTASKKSAAKSAKSPAPATKTAKSAAKPTPAPAPKAKKAAPAPKAAPAVKTKAAAPVVAAAPAPVPAAPAVKPVAPKPVVTTISARIDIGFGNVLYIRGEGAGLSWDQGQLMANVEKDLWQVSLGESAQPVIFKFLVNDLTWNTGPDYTVASGASVTLVPEF